MSTLHTGLVFASIVGLSDPVPLGPAQGWSARLDTAQGSSNMRFFVGRDAQEADRWLDQSLATFTLAVSPAPCAQERCAGDGERVWAYRDGNVAVVVAGAHDARVLAERTWSAVSDEPVPWPSAPLLRALPSEGAQQSWTVDAMPELMLRWAGGHTRSALGEPLVFTSPPTQVVGWDRFGRAATADDAAAP